MILTHICSKCGAEWEEDCIPADEDVCDECKDEIISENIDDLMDKIEALFDKEMSGNWCLEWDLDADSIFINISDDIGHYEIDRKRSKKNNINIKNKKRVR
jgi:hypothetical protein